MKKVIITVVVIALLASICVFTLTGCSKLNEWKDKFIELINPEDGSSNETEEGAFTVIVDEKQNETVIQEGNGIVLETVRLSSEGVEVEGNAYVKVITATVYPENAVDKSIDWTVSFVDPNSEWASNKNVADYITVEPEVDDGLTAIVYCHRAFGEQIIITATSRVNSSAYATCIVDFEKKFTEDSTLYEGYLVKSSKVSSFVFGSGSDFIDCNVVNLAGGIFVPSNSNATTLIKKRTVDFRPVYSDFTIDDDLSLSYYSEGLDNYYFYTAQVSNAFSAALNSVGISCVSGNIITQSGSDKLTDVIAAMVGYPSFDVYSGTSGEFASKFNSAARIVANNTDVVDFSITVCIRTEKVICDFKYDFKFDNSDSYLSVNSLSLSNSSLTF